MLKKEKLRIMRKKIISAILFSFVATSIFSGCGAKEENEVSKGTTNVVVEVITDIGNSSGGGVSTTKQDTDTDTAESPEIAESTESTEKVSVRIAYWNGQETMQTLLDFLKEEVPDVEIEFEFIDNSNYDSMIDTQLAAGAGPDIVCESPGAALKHAKLGYLAPLDELATKYSSAGTSVYSYEGSTYALPGISWFEGIYYNKAIFQENGLELPKTFDEYIAVCKKFQELGITPLAAGLKSWEPMLKNSMAFVSAEYLSQASGKGFGEDYRNGKVTLDGTWNSYLEKWSETIKEGIYTKDMINVEHAQALELFATGQAAMFCSGPWDYEAIMEKNPDLQLDMMPFYGTQESAGWLIGGPGCGFSVNQSSENKEAAMKVLAAISTPEGQAALWENNQGGSSYLTGVTFDLPEAYTSVSATLAAGNVYCPWNEWGVAAPAHETYGTEMQSYLLGTQDLATTLKNVDTVVSELLVR